MFLLTRQARILFLFWAGPRISAFFWWTSGRLDFMGWESVFMFLIGLFFLVTHCSGSTQLDAEKTQPQRHSRVHTRRTCTPIGMIYREMFMVAWITELGNTLVTVMTTQTNGTTVIRIKPALPFLKSCSLITLPHACHFLSPNLTSRFG